MNWRSNWGMDEYITGDQSFEERKLPVGEEEETRRRELL